MKNVLFLLIILVQSCPCHPQTKDTVATIAKFRRLEGNNYSFPKESIDNIINPVNKAAFFYGETHTRYFEPLFKYDFIVYLNLQRGVRNVFMEFGYSAAAIFNGFLATGDTNLLQLDILYTSPFYMEMWKKLYAYNKTLPSDKQLHIHGIDFESPKTFYNSLLILKPQQTEVPNSLKSIFKEISLWAAWDSKQINKLHPQNQKKVRAIFDKHTDDVTKLYGSNTASVYKIVHSNHFAMMDRSREKWMYANLENEIKENHIEEFVGFFGGDHINHTNPTALSVKLKSIARFKDNIFTIRMFCFNAVDNWSKETLECIGSYEMDECKQLSKTYLSDKDLRAVLLNDDNAKEPFLKGTANAYLFAEDR